MRNPFRDPESIYKRLFKTAESMKENRRGQKPVVVKVEAETKVS